MSADAASSGEWRIFDMYRKTSRNGSANLCDIREYYPGEEGSRYVCEVTPEDAGKILGAIRERDRLRGLLLETASTVASDGSPCWCPGRCSCGDQTCADFTRGHEGHCVANREALSTEHARAGGESDE